VVTSTETTTGFIIIIREYAMHGYKGLGLHLILIPRQDSMIPPDVKHILEQTVDLTARKHRLECAATHAREDHLHVLVSVTDEADIADFIGDLLENLRRLMRGQGAHLRSFDWDEGVHVTLLPQWHLEIMASFVRDQDRFHESRTLENELDEVFRPNSPPTFSDLGESPRISALQIH
jgi:REP element-mobilizing transposase RayT